MTRTLLVYCLILSFTGKSQINYVKQNIELISLSTPNFGVGGVDGRLYSGCWGWYQQNKNKEYAICGASNGTYFMDITNPVTPTVCAYVPGKLACTWREMKTYKNYCYIISDDSKPNKFQIVDMQYLPDSVHIVHNGTTYFERGHTIWIDQDKMYIGLVTYTAGFSPMNVYSLATPSVPVLLRELAADINSSIITEVHDMYVRNDTIYASAGWQGLFILKFNSLTNNFTQLGSYSGYGGAAYNHSSSLSKNGKHLIFCDEVPNSLPMHFVNVQNFGNIQPLQSFKPHPLTTPHNPYMIGNDFAVVACYQDGLYIYDVSQPDNVSVAGYFDTFHQGGVNVGDYFGAAYRGTWGAYPYLPSKIIIAQDMQNGVFLLDATKAFSNRTAIHTNEQEDQNITIYPNPAANFLYVKSHNPEPSLITIENLLGQIVFQEKRDPKTHNEIDISSLDEGSYIVSIYSNKKTIIKKLIIDHF